MKTIEEIKQLTDRELRLELGKLLPNVSLSKQMRVPNYPKNRNATYKAIESLPSEQFLQLPRWLPGTARTESEFLLLILQEESD